MSRDSCCVFWPKCGWEQRHGFIMPYSKKAIEGAVYMMLKIIHHAWLINTISMSEKSSLQALVNYADACHINGEHTVSVENEHSSRGMFALAGITGLRLIDEVVAAVRVLRCNQSETDSLKFRKYDNDS